MQKTTAARSPVVGSTEQEYALPGTAYEAIGVVPPCANSRMLLSVVKKTSPFLSEQVPTAVCAMFPMTLPFVVKTYELTSPAA